MKKISRRTLLAAIAGAGAVVNSTEEAQSASVAVNGNALWEPELLGEDVWLDWRSEDLPEGPVIAWQDRAGKVVAAQLDVNAQPIKLVSGEVLFERGGQHLLVPGQERGFLAHRAVVLLFRIDGSTIGRNASCLVALNGSASPASNARQPAIQISRAKGNVQLTAHWRDGSGDNTATLACGDDFETWHCLVTRRIEGRHYASIDGAAEVEVGENICLLHSKHAGPGQFGDAQGGAPRWALDTVLVLQGETGSADVARLCAWALWRKGAQSNLPPKHRYRDQPPLAIEAQQRSQFIEYNNEQWAALRTFWKEPNVKQTLEQAYRTPLDLSGYRLVFEDHFTHFTITDEALGKGPWWSPVHGAATGKARTLRLHDRPSAFTQSGSELTIHMTQTSRGWGSGVFTSVNLNGHGNTWKYGFFEFKARATVGNGFAAWPAFWVKSVNEFFRLTESRLEIDLYEGYNSDPAGHHQAYHNWPAARLLPGRLSKRRHVSNYTGLKASLWGDSTVNLFDNDWHRYGLMIDEEWVRFYFDDLELSRFATPPEAKQQLFILVDLALLPHEAEKAAGDYELTLDYIRVYQRDLALNR